MRGDAKNHPECLRKTSQQGHPNTACVSFSQYKIKMKDLLHEENSTAKRENGQGTALGYFLVKSLENLVINIARCTWLCTLKSIINAMFVNLYLNVNDELPI